MGVHAMNKWQQKWAMDEFVAGRLGPGEMGNGVLLEEVAWEEKMRMNAQYYDHAFQQYVSDIISVNRSLPDRSVPLCFVLILSSVFFIQLKTNLSMFNMVRHNVDIEYELSNYYNQNIAYHKGHKSNLHGFS